VRRTAARGALLLVAGCAAAAPCSAQAGPLTGYYLNVAGTSGSSPFSAGGASDFQRLRLMLAPSLGPLRLDAAYEQVLLYQQRPGAGFTALTPGASAASGEWLHLDWTLAEQGHWTWRHRFDRLSLALPAGRFELKLGRQAISWATTLLLTPADPFAPFDPSDPFREYLTGVDAARLQFFPGPFSGVDVVVRPMRTPAGRTVTAVARGKLKVGTVDLSAWGGALFGDPAAAVGATGAVAGAAWRAEMALREDSSGSAVVRAAIGLDRRWSLFGRDLYAVLEFQHDGFGAATARQLGAVLVSAPFRRGELQVLGRDVAAGQLQYQVHPLVSAQLLVLWDLGDGSAIVGPAVAVSASDDVSLRAGAFLPVGPGGVGAGGTIGSEFGVAPTFGYASVSWFF
jgi:hypothetical protein